MDIRQLEMFVSVAQTLNFSETAKRYYVTQPAVSHKIKMLEEEIGATVFHRTGNRFSLTEEGKVFLEYAMQIINLETEGKTAVKNMVEGASGIVRVAALPTVSEELATCLDAMSKTYPDIQVAVDQMEGDVLPKYFQDDEYDFYFGANRMFPESIDYHYRITKRTALKLFANKKLAESVNLQDWEVIKTLPFVSVSSTDPVLPSQIATICQHHDFSPQIVNFYNRVELVPLSVNAGIGIAILPASTEQCFPYENVVTVDIDDEEANIYHLIAWKTLRNSAAIKFASVIQEIYKDE